MKGLISLLTVFALIAPISSRSRNDSQTLFMGQKEQAVDYSWANLHTLNMLNQKPRVTITNYLLEIYKKSHAVPCRADSLQEYCRFGDGVREGYHVVLLDKEVIPEMFWDDVMGFMLRQQQEWVVYGSLKATFQLRSFRDGCLRVCPPSDGWCQQESRREADQFTLYEDPMCDTDDINSHFFTDKKFDEVKDMYGQKNILLRSAAYPSKCIIYHNVLPTAGLLVLVLGDCTPDLYWGGMTVNPTYYLAGKQSTYHVRRIKQGLDGLALSDLGVHTDIGFRVVITEPRSPNGNGYMANQQNFFTSFNDEGNGGLENGYTQIITNTGRRLRWASLYMTENELTALAPIIEHLGHRDFIVETPFIGAFNNEFVTDYGLMFKLDNTTQTLRTPRYFYDNTGEFCAFAYNDAAPNVVKVHPCVDLFSYGDDGGYGTFYFDFFGATDDGLITMPVLFDSGDTPDAPLIPQTNLSHVLVADEATQRHGYQVAPTKMGPSVRPWFILTRSGDRPGGIGYGTSFRPLQHVEIRSVEYTNVFDSHLQSMSICGGYWCDEGELVKETGNIFVYNTAMFSDQDLNWNEGGPNGGGRYEMSMTPRYGSNWLEKQCIVDLVRNNTQSNTASQSCGTTPVSTYGFRFDPHVQDLSQTPELFGPRNTAMHTPYYLYSFETDLYYLASAMTSPGTNSKADAVLWEWSGLYAAGGDFPEWKVQRNMAMYFWPAGAVYANGENDHTIIIERTGLCLTYGGDEDISFKTCYVDRSQVWKSEPFAPNEDASLSWRNLSAGDSKCLNVIPNGTNRGNLGMALCTSSRPWVKEKFEHNLH
eukprot:GHVN01064998.1.p1 GENE.GHVN01064998.1~~GHVN01064998.1.p1  ORF type:complete len:833 (+),score=63.08 GHVN01064998.1:49-2499(+)